MPFVSIGGTAIFPKGNNISQEITKAHYGAEKLGSAPPIYTSISNPGSSPPDKMVYFLKISPTPNHYPRRPGIPGKKPLGNSI
jgi:16S rRNA (guanine527-N7)-methyltransferase